MTKTYVCHGTCSRSITFNISDDGTVTDIMFAGGCNGNTKGVAALCERMKAEEIIKRLKGIRCGLKQTSCPDQLATAVEQALRGEI